MPNKKIEVNMFSSVALLFIQNDRGCEKIPTQASLLLWCGNAKKTHLTSSLPALRENEEK